MTNRAAKIAREMKNTLDEKWIRDMLYDSKKRVKDIPSLNFVGSNLDREKCFETWKSIYDFLVFKRSRLSNYPPLYDSLARLIKYHDNFIRDIKSLQLKGKSPLKHFNQLSRHLLEKYPTPEFWNNVWSANYPENWCDWYIEIAQGASVFKTSPLPITKKQAHDFMQLPKNFHPYEGLRAIQFTSLGGRMCDVYGILSCQIIQRHSQRNAGVEVEKFIQEIMRWFIGQPMLSPKKYNDISDWAYYKKFEANGEYRQPNLRMKGRDPNAVLREVDRWHNTLNNTNRKYNYSNDSWNGCGINDWVFEEIYNSKTGRKVNRWKIYELLSPEELIEEGRHQKHCIASYIKECQNGSSFIFSMTINNNRALTIQLNSHKVLSQAKGKQNRSPDGKEMEILKRWASEKKIQIIKWLL